MKETQSKGNELESELRAQGKKSHKSTKLGMRMFKTAIPIVVIALFIGFEHTWWLVIAAVAMGLAGLYIAGGGIKQKWAINNTVAENYIRPVLEEFFEIREYRPGGSIAAEKISASGLIGVWNEKKGSDYVSGTYRGVDIELSDVGLIYEYTDHDSDGHLKTRKRTVFHGQWLVCGFGTSLPTRIIVRERPEPSEVRSHTRFRDNVDTEHIAFEEVYQVETDDPHTAFMLLTPQFIEKLMEMRELLSGRFYICFDEKQVHIAVDCGRNILEVSEGDGDLNDFDALRERFRGEIRGLTQLIDALMRD